MTWARQSEAERRQAREQEKNRNMAALVGSMRPLRAGTYAGGTTVPAPKTEAYRDTALLEMARGRQCLLMVPAVCSHRIDTVVACHSNWGCHGKAGARKADDCYSVFGCAACHSWLDQGKADAVLKEMAFMQAHLLQVLAWRQIAADQAEPERFRRAARRALDRLNATPLGEAP